MPLVRRSLIETCLQSSSMDGAKKTLEGRKGGEAELSKGAGQADAINLL